MWCEQVSTQVYMLHCYMCWLLGPAPSLLLVRVCGEVVILPTVFLLCQDSIITCAGFLDLPHPPYMCVCGEVVTVPGIVLSHCVMCHCSAIICILPPHLTSYLHVPRIVLPHCVICHCSAIICMPPPHFTSYWMGVDVAVTVHLLTEMTGSGCCSNSTVINRGGWECMLQ